MPAWECASIENFLGSTDMKTITFKSTPQINLQADIYGAETSNPEPKPVILWIHDGALIMGTRTRIAQTHLNRLPSRPRNQAPGHSRRR
jgi:acetyl esterase/lipase